MAKDSAKDPFDENKIQRVVDQYIADRKLGKAIDLEQLVAGHADIADELRRECRRVNILFATHEHQPSKSIDANATVSENLSDADPNQTFIESNPNSTHNSIGPSDTFVDSNVFDAEPDSRADQLRIHCPECQGTIFVQPDTPWTELECEHCKAPFSLVGTDDENTGIGLSHIGHFELIERVGMGAFGTVWRARDEELNRFVSIKMPRKGLLSAEETKHFFKEARAAAQILHPNIVRVYEIGRFQGRAFIASEFIEGESLDKKIVDSRPTTREAVELTLEIAKGLEFAHQAGVIHRDIKPSNILIDEDGQPHIADFGLAKQQANDITVTMDGAIMGTPAYMSPEQAKGDARTSDPRSDIYSLGVILFRLLTGELPFRGTTPMLLQHVIHDEPPSPRRLNHLIAKDLETICLRCLQKKPDARYQSALDLSNELQLFLNGEPIQSRPVGPLVHAWRWCLRRKALASALAAIVLISTAATVVSVYLSVESSKAKMRADALANKAYRAENEAKQLTQTANRQSYAARMNQVQQAMDDDNTLQATELLKEYFPKPRQRDLRKFEWHYYWRVCTEGQLMTRIGRETSRCIAISPDGESIVWGDNSGAVFTSNKNMERIRELVLKHNGAVNSIHFAESASKFVTTASDGKALFWDLSSAAAESKTLGTNAFFGRYWNNDQWLVFGYHVDGKINLRTTDITTRLTINTIEVPGQNPSISLSPDNRYLAIGCACTDGKLILHDAIHQENVWVKTAPDQTQFGFESSIFLNAGTQLLVSYNTMTSGQSTQVFELFDTRTGASIKKKHRRLGAKSISSLYLSNDESHIIAATRSGTIEFYDSQRLDLVKSLSGHDRRVLGLAMSPVSPVMFSVGDDRTIRKWSSEPKSTENRIDFHSSVQEIVFAPDSSSFAVAGGSHVAIYSTNGLKKESDYEFSGFAINSLNFSRDQQTLLVTGSIDNSHLSQHSTKPPPIANSQQTNSQSSATTSSTVWEIDLLNLDATPFQVYQVTGKHLLNGRYSPTGDMIFGEHFEQSSTMARPAGVIVVSKTNKTERIIGRLSDARSAHTTVSDWAVSYDGTLLLTCGRDQVCEVWNYANGSIVGSNGRVGSPYPVNSIDISIDGLVAMGEDDGVISLWPLSDHSQLETFNAHKGSVRTTRFSPDGQTLFSCGSDRKIKIWDVESGQLRTEFGKHSSQILTMDISPNGHYIVSGDASGIVYLWDGKPLVKAPIDRMSK